MQTKFFSALFSFLLIAVHSNAQHGYTQKLENDICSNLIIGAFTCVGCAISDKDLPLDVKQDVNEALKKYKYCDVKNRDKLAEIVKIGDSEAGISGLNSEQRTKLKQYYQADRILFGYLKIQSNGSLLVTIEVNNLSTADQECFKRFTVPADQYENYENRQPFIEKGVSEMLLGSAPSYKSIDIESATTKDASVETPDQKASILDIKIDITGGSWAKGGKFKFYLDDEYIGKEYYSANLSLQKAVGQGSHVLFLKDWAGNFGKYTFFVDDSANYTVLIKALPMLSAEKFGFRVIKNNVRKAVAKG